MLADNIKHSINRIQANSEINEYLNLKRTGFPIIKTVANIIGWDDKVKNFYGTTKNAFIIEKEDILKFFEAPESDAHESEKVTATHLLLILASHTENVNGFVAGSPTIIITGVIQIDDDKTTVQRNQGDQSRLFQTTFGETVNQTSEQEQDAQNPEQDPAVQWEKQYTVEILPQHNKGNEKKITFTVR